MKIASLKLHFDVHETYKIFRDAPSSWEALKVTNLQSALAASHLSNSKAEPSSENQAPALATNEIEGEKPYQTVLVRNLPRCYDVSILLDELTSKGWSGTFDFLQVPVYFDTLQNKGCAIVNFIEAAHAGRFTEQFQGTVLPHSKNGTPLSIEPAILQGLEANRAEYYWKSRGRPSPLDLWVRKVEPFERCFDIRL